MPAPHAHALQPMPPTEPFAGPGALLIAPPMMHDPNFRRTVVLLCEHGAEGSFGLVLNRPLEIPLSDVLHSVTNNDLMVSIGGPVQPDTLHYVHRNGDVIPDTLPLFDDVYWGGDFEVLKALIESGQVSPRDLRFFLGYSGWSAGQLADEIERGGWILATADAASVFAPGSAQLWRTALRRIGGEYALLSNFPEDPRTN